MHVNQLRMYVNNRKHVDTHEEMKNEEMKNFCFGNVACNLLFYPLNCLWSIYDNYPIL